MILTEVVPNIIYVKKYNKFKINSNKITKVFKNESKYKLNSEKTFKLFLKKLSC